MLLGELSVTLSVYINFAVAIRILCTMKYYIIYYNNYRGIVRRQTNVAEHDPVACMNSSSTWGTPGGCPNPQFAGLEPNVRFIYIYYVANSHTY